MTKQERDQFNKFINDSDNPKLLEELIIKLLKENSIGYIYGF